MIKDAQIDALLKKMDINVESDDQFSSKVVASATALPQRKAGVKTEDRLIEILSGVFGMQPRPSWVFASLGALAFFMAAGVLTAQSASSDMMLDPVFYADQMNDNDDEMEVFY